MNPEKFIKIVDAVASMSKDTTQVGCVVVSDDGAILSVGYNGFPRGVTEDSRRTVRPAKYLWTAHAEENAIAQAARVGATLMGGTMILSGLFPCTTCARMIIQAGIKRVIAPIMAESCEGRWHEERRVSLQMFSEAGVEVSEYD
jgi:dCMP deaminase